VNDRQLKYITKLHQKDKEKPCTVREDKKTQKEREKSGLSLYLAKFSFWMIASLATSLNYTKKKKILHG
jgi:hypothetical protein